MNTFVIAGIAVLVVLFIIMMCVCYVQTPPSKALILSGLGKNPRTLIGTGGFKIPILERKDTVYLGQIGVDIKTNESVPTLDWINVNVDAVAKVQVIPDTNGVRLAAKNFLNMTAQQIAKELQDTLEANMREIIGTIELKTLNNNREAFGQKVLESAVKDMEQLGIKILCFNIQNITDKQGLIEDLGADNTEAIKKTAAINRAESQRDVKIAQARADKEANDARVAADEAIAVRQNQLALKQAELKKIEDTAKAEADAAYEISKQKQQKEVNASTVDAEIEMAQRKQKLEDENVKVTENRLRAEVNKKAEAQKYETETKAAADLQKRQREAEAKTYEAQKEAEAVKAKADADLYAAEMEAKAKKLKADAAAYEIAETGKSEAEAIRLKGEAEAEAMEKKAEAYQKYEGAAVIEMITKILPDVSKNVAEPMGNIKTMNVYGGEASTVSENVPAVIKQTMDVIQSTTGVDMGSVIKSKTNLISAKVN